MKIIIFFLGLSIFLFSFLLAFNYNYNHFYEFTLVGLFLILYPLRKKNLSRKTFIILYAIYFLLGIVIDLLGQLLGFWHYTYHNLFEYLFLYLLIYPLGAFVILQSYFLADERIRLGAHKKRNVSIPILWFLSFVGLVIFLITSSLINRIFFSSWAIFFGLSLAIFAGISTNLFLEIFFRRSYVRDLMEFFPKTVIVTLIATYVNAFIHEYPNTFAPEWIYTIHTYTFLDNLFLRIPILVWLGWPILTISSLIPLYFVRGCLDKQGKN